eukprot:187029_1
MATAFAFFGNNTKYKPQFDIDIDDEKKSIEGFETHDTPQDERKQIISIDFGSFGSIASYCLPQSPAKYSLVKDWKGMGGCDGAMQKKTLTALLWNIHERKTIAFGYEAQKLYFEYEKIIKDKHKSPAKKLKKKFGDERIKLAYFKHFKPHLVGDDPLRKDKYIWSVDKSAKLSILDLITYSLIEIKTQAMIEAERFRGDSRLDLEGKKALKEDEILWTLSTPSIWDDTSRGAFKECAIDAGMTHHVIGLEPEFALFCMAKADQAEFLETDSNEISMVLDCGGGTVDATCIEIIAGGPKMEETLPRKGIDMGSLDIDEEYYKMLEGVLGREFIAQFQREQPHHWNSLQTSFWKAKHIVDANKFADSGLNVDIPRALWKLLKTKFNDDDEEDDFEDYVTGLFQKYCTKRYGEAHKDYIEYDEEDDSINIQIPVWNDFHKAVLDAICDFVEELLSADSMDTCEQIILVGGFAQSKFLQQRLMSQFRDGVDEFDERKIAFDIAPQPSWAVTIGGLFWANNRKNYRRKMWLTYGFEVNKPWKRGDPLSNKHRDMNTASGFIKKHVFDPVIFKNDTFDENQQEQRHYTIPFNAGVLTLNLYAVDSEHGAEYTTDKDEDGTDICTIAAQYELKLKDEKWIKLTKQALPITIEFEATMLRILITQPDRHQAEMIIKNPRIN